MFPPFFTRFTKETQFFKHDISIIKEVFEKWMFNSSGYELSDQFTQSVEGVDNDQEDIAKYKGRCYIFSPSLKTLLALFYPLNEDELKIIAVSEKTDFSTPTRHYVLNDLIKGYHDKDSAFEDMIELALVNSSYWMFEEDKLQRHLR
jgi:hypothetical protein